VRLLGICDIDRIITKLEFHFRVYRTVRHSLDEFECLKLFYCTLSDLAVLLCSLLNKLNLELLRRYAGIEVFSVNFNVARSS